MGTSDSAERPPRLRAREWGVRVGLYLVLLAFDVWLVFALPNGPWQDKVSLVLAIVGVFGLGVGLLNRSELKAALPEFIDIEAMTSHNLQLFVDGNLRPLGASSEFMIALLYGRDPWSRPDMAIGWRVALVPLSVVSFLAVVAACLLWFLAVAAYLIIVAPFAYLAYAVVSLPLLRIRDPGRGADQRPPGIGGIDPREIVKANLVELRVFMVGAILPTFAFVIQLIQLY